VLAARSFLIQRDNQCMSGGTRGRTDTNLAKTVLRFEGAPADGLFPIYGLLALAATLWARASA
jgi:hypothetical protein